MAIFHLSAKILTRSCGHHAVKAAAYRAGERLVCAVSGLAFDFRRKRHVGPTWIQTPAGSPAWTLTRASLWSAAEAAEKRVNSQLAREVEVALPIEFDAATQERVLRQYVADNFVRLGIASDVCIHARPGNPHAHIMLSLREIGPTGFGAKRRDWNDAKLVVEWRASWAALCNRTLEQLGSPARIDHRSNAERGVMETPTVHVGRSKSTSTAEVAYRLALNSWRRTVRALRNVKAEISELRDRLTALRPSPSAPNKPAAPSPLTASPRDGQPATAGPQPISRALQRLVARSLQSTPKSIAPQQTDGNSPDHPGGSHAVSTH
jgi:ATP-dependent exoDNAse (exonuclease V) alpha subunit